MKLSALAIAVLAGLASSSKTPICIVGAGPAGLAAAYELEQSGKSIHLFEKHDAVGGKCQAVYQDGTYFPLGATIFPQKSYNETQKLIDIVGVETAEFPDAARVAFDWQTGSTQLIPLPEGPTTQRLKQEVADYSKFWEDQFDDTIGFRTLDLTELSKPTLTWMTERGYQILPTVFNTALTIYGYGDYREIPVAYSLMFFTPGVLQSAITTLPGYKVENIEDFHEMFVRFARLILGPICLGTTIKSIDRSLDEPVITYETQDGEEKRQNCTDVILAFPPTLQLLKESGLELHSDEEELFGAVKVTNYFAAAVRASGAAPDVGYYGAGADPFTPPPSLSQPVYLKTLHRGTGVLMAYSQGGDGAPPRPDLAYGRMLETVSRLNYDPRTGTPADAVAVTDEDVVGFSGTVPYFPHVDSEAFAGGFYQKLHAMQGKYRTYYASGLNGFENVEHALRAGKDIAHSYVLP